MPSHADDTDPTQLGAFRHLDESMCWDVLARGGIGRVGVVLRRRPVILPVNYVVDGRTIVFRTDFGTKLTAAALRRPAVFEVDEFDAQFQRGLSVIAHGWLHEVTDPTTLARMRELLLRPWADGPRQHFVTLHPVQITGRGIGVVSEVGGL